MKALSMKKTLILIYLLIFTVSHAHALPVITIVRGQDFKPYHFFDQSKVESGFIIEIIQSVTTSMGMDVEFLQYPWSRCLEMMKKGRADAMMNLFKTDERMEYMFFPDNVLGYEVNRFFKLKSNPVNYSGDMATIIPFTKNKRLFIMEYNFHKDFDQGLGKL